MGQIGAGTPVGALGAVIEYAPITNLMLEAGMGLTSSGPHIASMLRLRLPLFESTSGGVAAGLTAGDYGGREGVVGANPEAKRAEPGYFGNAALVLENRFGSAESGFQMRYLIGYALLLNRDDLECTEEIDHCRADHSNEGGRVPFFGLSFGYYF
jgi:hypothetical protein